MLESKFPRQKPASLFAFTGSADSSSSSSTSVGVWRTTGGSTGSHRLTLPGPTRPTTTAQNISHTQNVVPGTFSGIVSSIDTHLLECVIHNSDNWFCHFDNWKDNPGDLWNLRHWLQFWQLRTWIHDNLCYLTINCDTGQHSQFLRCFIKLTTLLQEEFLIHLLLIIFEKYLIIFENN